jgi:hypothetical protein
MRRVAIIPAVIALTVLLCTPFSFVSAYGSAQPGGLVCYCCSGQGMACSCTAFSCPRCNSKTESPDTDWSPDLILPSFEMAIHFHQLVSAPVCYYPPRTIYAQVPVKPPNILSPLAQTDC